MNCPVVSVFMASLELITTPFAFLIAQQRIVFLIEILKVQGVGEEVSPTSSHRLLESIRGEISITQVCA